MKLRIARKIEKRNYPKFGGYEFDVIDRTSIRMANRLSKANKLAGKYDFINSNEEK